MGKKVTQLYTRLAFVNELIVSRTLVVDWETLILESFHSLTMSMNRAHI